MKKFDLLSAIVNGILSVCMGIAAVGCLITAFGLEVSSAEILLACIFWAVLTCVVLQFRRGWIAIPVGLALWWLLLWARDTGAQFGALLRVMFTIYSRGYGIQVPSGLLQYTDLRVTFAMEAIAGTVTLLAGLSLTKLRSGALAVMVAALPVLPCLVVTDTVPHEFWLFLLLMCIGLVILSQSLRRRDPKQASRLTAILLVPVLLCNIWLFQANPQQGYDKQPENSFVDFLAELFEPFTGSIDPSISVNPGLSLGDVNLRSVGPKQEDKALAMEVETDLEGVLYLRGKSYSDYDGLSWEAAAINGDELSTAQSIYRQSTLTDGKYASLDIRTASAHNFQYAAYYPARKVSLQGGAFPNPYMARHYSMDADPLREDWQSLYRQLNPTMTLASLRVTDGLPLGFTELPQRTLTKAEKILKENGITGDQHIVNAANAIADLVRNSASYSLNTPYMPAGEQDFALWFLEDSDTGYCVHFATAAAVLLRAAGIPARYVEGYVTRVNSDGTARVTEDQAHAWVEYYLPKLGWVTLEATPSAGWMPPAETVKPTQPVTRPTAPSRPTGPSATEPSQAATTPSASTAPSSATVPSTTVPNHTGPEKPKADLTWLWTTLQVLLLLILAAVVLIGQWRLRLYLRNIWLHRGNANTQALRRWRFTKRLAKLRRQDAPAALKELAQKAKFSQHTISQEELAAFNGYFDRSITHLKSRPIYLRLVYRLIFAAY